ncbi:hypothetical protein QFZ22_005742 [Streptomyces canus]|uniref:Transposase n=1 Tax=Streptomyces canus TaxID=58343 RepID=A0AAW8FL20_9ACTN|nr:hypothetical protein [Streptomyces canus]MDQ0909757.1 hypothetical protein [Streptomyces canus]
MSGLAGVGRFVALRVYVFAVRRDWTGPRKRREAATASVLLTA